MGNETLSKAISNSCGKSTKEIRDLFNKEGDLGKVAAISKSK